jgi:hypothetical protein
MTIVLPRNTALTKDSAGSFASAAHTLVKDVIDEHLSKVVDAFVVRRKAEKDHKDAGRRYIQLCKRSCGTRGEAATSPHHLGGGSQIALPKLKRPKDNVV